MSSIAVFFTSDIPEKTLNRFLDAGQAYFKDSSSELGVGEEYEIGVHLKIVTSKDYSQYMTPTTRPFHPFHSPFDGKSPDQVASWFREASAMDWEFPRMSLTFIILDEQTVKDERSGLLVGLSTQFNYEPVQTMRCDVYIVHGQAINYQYGSEDFASDYAGYFARSRLVVTKVNQKRAEI